MHTRNSTYNKMYNRRLIVRRLFQNSVSRADLARITGLSRSAITLLVDELIAEGVVRESGISENSFVGRNPALLEIVPDCYHILSVDIARDGCSVGLVNFGGKVLTATHMPVQPDQTAAETVEAICQKLKDMAGGQVKLLGLGITTPGPVDTAHGRVDNIPDFGKWSRFSIVDAFQKHVDYDITLERDANAVSQAELYFGTGQRCDDFMVFVSYMGVGLGVVKNRRLYSGKMGLTPEIGHITVNMNGAACACGNTGCLHDYFGHNIIVAHVQKDFPEVSDWRQIVDRAYGGETYFHNVMDHYARVLSFGVVNAVNLFAIDTVVLSGFLAYRPEKFISALSGYVNSAHIARNFYDVHISATQIHQNANLIGAASGVIEKNLFIQ